jgi:hypothetical protein
LRASNAASEQDSFKVVELSLSHWRGSDLTSSNTAINTTQVRKQRHIRHPQRCYSKQPLLCSTSFWPAASEPSSVGTPHWLITCITGTCDQKPVCRSGWRHCAQVSSTSFATKAEDYDLIVAEAGLVRIEGYAACCSACLCSQHNVHAQLVTRFSFFRYDGTGFIVNDVQVQGAVFCLADLFMMWNLKSWQELTPDALSMLHLFKPAPGNMIVHACYLGPYDANTFTR